MGLTGGRNDIGDDFLPSSQHFRFWARVRYKRRKTTLKRISDGSLYGMKSLNWKSLTRTGDCSFLSEARC